MSRSSVSRCVSAVRVCPGAGLQFDGMCLRRRVRVGRPGSRGLTSASYRTGCDDSAGRGVPTINCSGTFAIVVTEPVAQCDTRWFGPG